MDRRVAKTRKSIMQAFYVLLDKKKYCEITIQDIIDKADIGRSTFYAHFETKDELLHTMCKELFEHIFSSGSIDASSRENSSGADDLRSRIYHLCTHLYDNKNEIVRIMRFESSEIYKHYLKEYLEELFKERVTEMKSDIPESFMMKQFTDSFTAALEWWSAESMETLPEDLAGYYCRMYF